MRNNNCMGIVFCNFGDESLTELTTLRTIGSVPFGCRYRLIDFTLSSLVNAGISKVGLVTRRNFQSLSDHVGNGRPWDLARKKGGLCILSPYLIGSTGIYKGKIDALYGCMNYLEKSSEEYVIISDSNVVANINLEKMIDEHNDTGADITIAYKKNLSSDTYITLNGKRAIAFTAADDADVKENCSLNIMLMKKDLLVRLVNEANRHNYTDFNSDILQRCVDDLVINGYEITEYASVINSMQSYFNTNMELLKREVRDDLFNMNNPVFTKLRDDMPSRYGFDSSVSDSLIADGCLIEGEVKNSIIFRGVHVGKNATVENCILMQSADVGDNTKLSYVIADKNVTFKNDRTLVGCLSFPLVIGKGLIV